MNRSSKVFSGILSFLPLILTFVIIVLVFAMFPRFVEWEQQEPDFYIVWGTIWPLIITAIITGVVKLGALIFFIIHMLNNKKVETGERIIWILVFIFTGGIGYPIYWYMRIWKESI